MPPTRTATLFTSPGERPFSVSSMLCTRIPRSLNQRSAFRVSAHFFLPKIWTMTSLTKGILLRMIPRDDDSRFDGRHPLNSCNARRIRPRGLPDKCMHYTIQPP